MDSEEPSPDFDASTEEFGEQRVLDSLEMPWEELAGTWLDLLEIPTEAPDSGPVALDSQHSDLDSPFVKLDLPSQKWITQQHRANLL